MIDIFIPSYHRPGNIKTVKYFVKIGYDVKKLHVFIDSEADDWQEYEYESKKIGFNLYVFDINEARNRYDYVHRASISRRSAGQARNMFYEVAKEREIRFFVMQDDDTTGYEIKKGGKYIRTATLDDIIIVFESVVDLMRRHGIGLFGISQTGDFIGGDNNKLLRHKVMNTTFVDAELIYRGERGVQDDDTSQFASVMNMGLFTGSLGDGLALRQTTSAKQQGGLTDLYNECKLLNKSLVVPIQFPSAVIAERQEKNGGRLHHRIKSKYLYPRLIKNDGGRSNIDWRTYPEDYPFTNEPKRH